MKCSVYCSVCDGWTKAELLEIRATDGWIEFLLMCAKGHRTFCKVLDVAREDD